MALRYEKGRAQRREEGEPEQYQLFATSQSKYRVFVTGLSDPIPFVVWFYRQRGGAKNLIKEANNDAGLAAYPSGRFDVNGNHFQFAMLAYNLNCWPLLFHREPRGEASALRHTTLATSRLRFLFVAAKIWRHMGRKGVSYSDHYEEEGRLPASHGAAAPDCGARPGLCPGDAAGLALRKAATNHGAPCIEIHGLAASATKQATSARELAGKEFREDDETAKIELS